MKLCYTLVVQGVCSKLIIGGIWETKTSRVVGPSVALSSTLKLSRTTVKATNFCARLHKLKFIKTQPTRPSGILFTQIWTLNPWASDKTDSLILFPREFCQLGFLLCCRSVIFNFRDVLIKVCFLVLESAEVFIFIQFLLNVASFAIDVIILLLLTLAALTRWILHASLGLSATLIMYVQLLRLCCKYLNNTLILFAFLSTNLLSFFVRKGFSQ